MQQYNNTRFLSPWLTPERCLLIATILRRHQVQRAGVFGSMARNDDTPESDLDLVFEPAPESGLWQVVEVSLDLAEALGRRVDAIPFSSLHPMLRERILHDYVELWPAEILAQEAEVKR